jgi:hypothetical protein
MPTKNSKLAAIHSIFMSLTPLNICIVFLKAIYYTKTDSPYIMLDINDVDEKHPIGNFSLLDSMILNSLPPELEKKIGHERNPSRNAEFMQTMNKHWEKEENTKETMRNNILDCIIKGFEQIYTKKEKGSREMESLEIEDPAKPKVEKPPLLRRIILF